MDKVPSKDGTTISFERLGSGPPVVLVCGGSVDRSSNAPLAVEALRYLGADVSGLEALARPEVLGGGRPVGEIRVPELRG